MTEYESEKYYAKLTMDNCVIAFVAIKKDSRELVTLFMNPLRELTTDPIKAAYFSDIASASTFLRAMGTDLPKMPDGYELVSHSNYYEMVTVTYKYPRRTSLEDSYKVEMEYRFWRDDPKRTCHAFSATGSATLRLLDNASTTNQPERTNRP